MSPARRRRAVAMLRDRLGVGERRACRHVGQHRSTQRYEPRMAADDAALRRRLGDSTVPAQRLKAERPNQVWALGFQFDQTADVRPLKLLNVVDEFTREALEMLTERRIDSDATVAALDRLVAERGALEHIRMDNAPELTAHALRDWCRFSGTGTAFIEPGSPWQNPYVESFNARVRDELLDTEELSCLTEAKVVIADWRHDYNHRRPHSSLGMKAPAAFAATWTAPARAADTRQAT